MPRKGHWQGLHGHLLLGTCCAQSHGQDCQDFAGEKVELLRWACALHKSANDCKNTECKNIITDSLSLALQCCAEPFFAYAMLCCWTCALPMQAVMNISMPM